MESKKVHFYTHMKLLTDTYDMSIQVIDDDFYIYMVRKGSGRMTQREAINYLRSSGMSDEQIKAIKDAFTSGVTHAEKFINMSDKIAIHNLYALRLRCRDTSNLVALDMAIHALEKKRNNISDMLYDIYMEGVNMTGEYQGCWVRFKDIEKIVNKYMADIIERS